MSDAPLIVDKDAAELKSDLVKSLQTVAPEWSPTDPKTGQIDQVGAALVGIFARFGEIVIQRLNQVPQRNFLAFLNMLGASNNPPQPARVPLTFTLAPGSIGDAVVPPGTQVAAPPAEGEQDPVLFATDHELTVVAATLHTLITVDAERDMVADHSALLDTPGGDGIVLFAGDRASEHLLYVGYNVDLTAQTVSTLILNVQLNAAPVVFSRELKPTDVQWEVWDGKAWQVIASANVMQPPTLNGEFRFFNLPKMPLLTINGIASRWLRCRLLKPLTPSANPSLGMLRTSLLPVLDNLNANAVVSRGGLIPDAAFFNTQKLDTTKPFMPFGERPKLGDAFYFGSNEAFALPGSSVTLSLNVMNPATASGPDLTDLLLRWEVWTNSGWSLLGESSIASQGGSPNLVADSTLAFTSGTGNTVTVTLPANVATLALNGVSSYWIRVQIVHGNYGLDARYVKDTTNSVGFRLDPSTLAPPVIRSLTVGYTFTTAQAAADVVGFNNLEYENVGANLAAGTSTPMFRGLDAQPPIAYAAFSLPDARGAFPNRPINLYHSLHALQYGEAATPLHPEIGIQSVAPGSVATHRFMLINTSETDATFAISSIGGVWPRTISPTQQTLSAGDSVVITVAVTVPPAVGQTVPLVRDRAFLQALNTSTNTVTSSIIDTRTAVLASPARRLRYEYWNGSDWVKLSAFDGTDRMQRTGLVEFLGPSDFARSRQFGVDGFWVRALFDRDESPVSPRLRALLPNTVMATQAVTISEEVLGSSDGSEQQQYQTARSPVLADQLLEVREPGPLSDSEVTALIAAHGDDAVTPVDSQGRSEFWVRWDEVTDLHGAGPLDRAYVLDHLTGLVTFGNGIQGRIPPRGSGNVKMTRYQTGGGQRGNRAPGTIVQLTTTVPNVASVFNFDAATGGFGAETTAAVIERAPRALRHGGRAVAAPDYEDLAHMASPEIARAKCVPLRRLRRDPLGAIPITGAVSVIIVPGGADAKPSPSLELIDATANFLNARQAAEAEISVVGPLYVRVDVFLEVVLSSIEFAGDIEREIRADLAAFLHPLTGGRDGQGWDFGREPQVSDLHAVVNAVPGVDHIRQLVLTPHEDLAGTRATGRFLVYSGQHQIELAFLEDQ